MKNLIITTGILLLMVTGILYDQDCTNVVRMERRLSWVCEEMAAGAAGILETEAGTLEDAKTAAAGILRRNLGLDQNLYPKETGGVLQGPVVWSLEVEEGVVRVEVDCGEGQMVLGALQGLVRLKGEAEFVAFHKKDGKIS